MIRTFRPPSCLRARRHRRVEQIRRTRPLRPCPARLQSRAAMYRPTRVSRISPLLSRWLPAARLCAGGAEWCGWRCSQMGGPNLCRPCASRHPPLLAMRPGVIRGDMRGSPLAPVAGEIPVGAASSSSAASPYAPIQVEWEDAIHHPRRARGDYPPGAAPRTRNWFKTFFSQITNREICGLRFFCAPCRDFSHAFHRPP